jgi:Dyp-type peroxidase family
VFRRLRQDVPAFRAFIEATAQELQVTPELLRAKLVGRYQSGAPLERTHDQAPTFAPDVEDPSIADPAILDPLKINNFDFVDGSDDQSGNRVPHAAHVRKVYPRDSNPPGETGSEAKRILRRGVAFGESFQEGAPADGPQGPNPDYPNDRGLLFLCYQGSIARQFEFIQSTWANSPNLPDTGGHDPIIGLVHPVRTFQFPGKPAPLSIANFVTTTGGDYFFQPSIDALKTLAQE